MPTVGYFHNDYGKGGIKPFLEALEAVYPDARIVNCAMPCPENLMMAARTQAYAMLRKSVRGDLILLDTDVIARKPADVFDGEWHVGLTKTREETPLMRFNGGVIFLRDTDEAQAFMDQVQYHATVIPQDFGDWMWYVDQLALSYVGKNNGAVKVFGGEYNYIPQSEKDVPECAYFLHYKGKKRKGWLH